MNDCTGCPVEDCTVLHGEDCAKERTKDTAKLEAAEAVIGKCYMVISEYQMFFATPESTEALTAIKAWEAGE